MHFELTHAFAASPEVVAAVLLDERYQASLADVSDALAERTLLSQQSRPGGTTVRRVRCVLGIDMGAAARFIGNGEPAWVEEATWNPDGMHWHWVVQPEVGGQILSAAGGVALEAAEGGTARVVTGDVTVRVPLYGGKVEGWIVESLERAYEQEAERLRTWLGP